MRQILTVFFLFMTGFGSYAQKGFFIDASAGFEVIPTTSKNELVSWNVPVSSGIPPATIVARLEEYYVERPTFDFTLGYQHKLMPGLSVESGLGISFIGFERGTRINIPDNTSDPDVLAIPDEESPFGKFYGFPSGTVTDQSDMKTEYSASIFYAKIPLNFTYTYKKLCFGTGISVSSPVNSVQKNSGFLMAIQRVTLYDTLIADRWYGDPVYYDSITVNRAVPVPYENKSTSGKGLTTFIATGNLSIKYRIFRELWLNATYYQSFTPIYTEKYRIAGKAKSRSVMIGVRYYL